MIAVTLAVTAPLAYFAAQIRIDPSAESMLDPADPDLLYHHGVRDLFGTEEVDVVVLVADDVFRAATLEKLRRLDQRLGATPGVRSVRSLASVEIVTGTEDGGIEYGAAMPAIPASGPEMARLKALALENPILAGNFVSEDGRAATLLLTYETMSEADFIASGIYEAVSQILDEESGPERLYRIGPPTLKVASARYMRGDIMKFMPGTTIVLVLTLLFSFRSLRGVIVPMATIGIGLVWTIGLMSLLDVPLDVIGMVLPSLILAVGSAYSMHVVARYYDEAQAGGDAREISFRSVRHLGLPIFVTGLTTVIGFASLMVYDVIAIQRFGGFLTFGIAALFLLALTFTPALLAVLRVPEAKSVASGGEWPVVRRVLDSNVRFASGHPRSVIGVTILILAAFAWRIPDIRVETSYTTYFPEGSPIRVSTEAIGEHFGGSVGFFVAIDGPEPGSITRIDTLRRVEALEHFIARIPDVGKTISITDTLKVLNRALHEGDAAHFELPETDAAVQQYLLLVPPEATESVLSPDGARAVISVRSSLDRSLSLKRALADIQQFADSIFPAGFTVRPTGMVALFHRSADELSTGQVQSVLIAVTVVFLIMSILFVSVRLGFVAMFPNLVPVVIYFGILGWLDIPLSISTAVIASIALGLGVDEAIHLLAEFNHQVREHGDQELAIRKAMSFVGPPVLFTTIALSLGFLVPALSSFLPIQQFAILSSINIVTSLLADVLILPAFLASMRFVTLWDLLGLKLGRAPQETIPLLHGLRPAQARIAALMGQLRTFAPGEHIIRQGEPSDAMYILISGRAEVRVGKRSILVREVGRGDLVGEMGLVRGGRPRTADVIAVEPTEVLVADQRFFTLLRRRYPRIGTQVLFNMSQILSDRLEGATNRLVEGDAEREQAVSG